MPYSHGASFCLHGIMVSLDSLRATSLEDEERCVSTDPSQSMCCCMSCWEQTDCCLDSLSPKAVTRLLPSTSYLPWSSSQVSSPGGLSLFFFSTFLKLHACNALLSNDLSRE